MHSYAAYAKLEETDFVKNRLRLCCLAAEFLFQRIFLAMAGSDEPGALRFVGSKLGLAALVASLVCKPETEVETHLQTLLEIGLLQLREDGVLALPVYAGGTSRKAEAARNNGLKGGRRGKDGLTAYQRRQGNLLLPVAGGRALTSQAEAQTETHAEPTGISLSLKPKTEELKLKPAVDSAEFNRIGRAAFEAAGFDLAKDRPNWGIVRQWLADGATEAVILRTVADVAERMRARGNPPKHMGAFTGAIQQAMAAEPAAIPPAEQAAREAWRAAIAVWEADARYGRLMPMPVLEDYLQQARAA